MSYTFYRCVCILCIYTRSLARSLFMAAGILQCYLYVYLYIDAMYNDIPTYVDLYVFTSYAEENWKKGKKKKLFNSFDYHSCDVSINKYTFIK